MNLKGRLLKQLKSRQEKQSFRHLSVKPDLVDFSSNDYLGFARSEGLRALITSKAELVSANGATGSRLLSGNSTYIERVETILANTFNAERALIFNSGYMANLAALSCLPQRGDTILYDELSHACIKDGARLSMAHRFSFRHNDLHDLEQKIKIAKGNIFIAIESAYSMDGDICPLREIVALSEKYDAHIILDEAHSTGVLGPNGSGLSGSLGLEEKIDIRVYTFGKAMGIHGAGIACNDLYYNYFINFARPFIYTTAPAPHAVASIEGAFEFLASNIHLQSDIHERVSFFNRLFDKTLKDKLIRTSFNHPVQAILFPGNDTVKKVAFHLQSAGYDVRPILSPTVKEGEERLRICLHTYNSDMEISGLITTLAAL